MENNNENLEKEVTVTPDTNEVPANTAPVEAEVESLEVAEPASDAVAPVETLEETVSEEVVVTEEKKEEVTTEGENAPVVEEVKVEEPAVAVEAPLDAPTSVENQVNEAPVVPEVKNEEPKKKSNLLPILIIIIGVLCLVGGAVLMFTGDEETPDNTETGNNNQQEEQKPVVPTDAKSNIKLYNEYKNYDMTATAKVVSPEMTLEVVESGKYDLVSNIFYTQSTVFGMSVYTYFDGVNKIEYVSDDDTNWTKTSESEMAFPVIIDNIINKIKDDSTIVASDDGSFSFNVDSTLVDETSDAGTVVPVVVKFDSDGFVSEINIDMTSITEDVTSASMVYKFADVNKLSSVTIPERVLTTAVEETDDWDF